MIFIYYSKALGHEIKEKYWVLFVRSSLPFQAKSSVRTQVLKMCILETKWENVWTYTNSDWSNCIKWKAVIELFYVKVLRL